VVSPDRLVVSPDHLVVSPDHLVVSPDHLMDSKLQLPHHQHLSPNSKQQHHLQLIQEPFHCVYSVTHIYGLEMGQVFGISLFLWDRDQLLVSDGTGDSGLFLV
jgi:hypothetical protein